MAVLVAFTLALASAMAQPPSPPPVPASPATPARPAEESDPMAAIEKLLQQDTPSADSFVYQREGRPDPFFPFLTQQPQKGEASGELAGMQRFEPGQLRLVAIIHSRKGPVAMVQDSAGIGYTLRRGSKIGRNGEVVDIVGNKVIIRQEAFSTTKEKQYRTTEMVLTKEGDKKP
ncbi:MAG TPA: hypothetical protein VLL73_00870 [Desulfurivibrionaceae bacterium]|nr:hypothetical protein [Desulfurivibrionaceae bacterium]